jgi:hypothetical protein
MDREHTIINQKKEAPVDNDVPLTLSHSTGQSPNGNQTCGNCTTCPDVSNGNGSQEEITPDCHVPKKAASVVRAKGSTRSLQKMLRRLSSSGKSIGSLESISGGGMPIEKIRSSIDTVESHLERIEANGDESFNIEDLEDDYVISAIMECEDYAEEVESDDESECSDQLRDSADKLRELYNLLKTAEWSSLQNMNSNECEESKQQSTKNYDQNGYENSDDGDDLLAEKLEKSSVNGSNTFESVTDVLRNASILPCSLLALKSYLIEEKEKVRVELEMISAREINARNFRNSTSTTRKVAGRNSIFRTSEEAEVKPTGTSNQKRSSSLFKTGFFARLSKAESRGDNADDDSTNEKHTSKLLHPNVEKMQDETSENDSVQDHDHHQPMHNAIEQDEHFPPLHNITDEVLMEDESVKEAFILHFIFRKFSTPPPSFNIVKNVLEYEQRRISNSKTFAHSHKRQSIHHIPLAQDVVVNVGDSSVDYYPGCDDCPRKATSFVAMILETDVLFKLPLHFRLAFLRILIRLLTSESDEEYDDALSLEPQRSSTNSEKVGNMGAWKNKGRPTVSPTGTKNGMRLSNTRSWRNEDLRYLHERNRKRNSLSFDSLYSVVRFCCGEHPGGRIDKVIGMIESLIEPLETESRKSKSLILYPLCRLLGLLCTAGISAKQLKKILSLIRDDTFRMNLNIHVLRALIVATEGSSLAKKLRGKASPQSFFNFGRSNGISKTIYPANNAKVVNGWPFKTSFGMSCWFRIEDFQSHYGSGDLPVQRLFKICSGDGTAFEISFKLLGSSSICAAHIVFSVRDSDVSRKLAQTPLSRGIELIGCPIVPRVWFHIAVRHTKKSYLSLSKDEVTILLDGKPMLTEQLKFPKPSTLGADSSHSKQQPAQPTEISFCSGLDAQAGSVYVFHDAVSDETFYSLYKFTSGKSETFPKQSERPGIIATIENKVNPLPSTSIGEEDSAIMTLKKADMEEMVIPRARTSSGNGTQIVGRPNNATALDLIGDDEFCNDIHNPTKGEFSRQAFVSNIYFVWDPTRVTGDDNLVLEAHSSIHVSLNKRNCVPWKMRSAKDVISSIGGIQCLLPIFRSLIIPETAPRTNAVNNESKEFETGAVIPLAFSLLAAFLRDKDINGREWIRCGGTEILEYFLLQSKERYASSWSNSHQRDLWVNINAFRRHHHFAEELVSILLDLTEACSYNTYLESKVSSRLIFNVDLWLGGLGKIPGTALHAVLLPALSSITKADPEEASCSIRTGLMMNLVREYTIVPKKLENGVGGFFDSTSYAEIMTKTERKHMVDIVMGIILMVLSVEVKLSNLLPLIRFISFNLDMEWENVNNSRDSEGELVQGDPETRRLRFCASEKACSLLVLLLQSRPVIPGLFKTLNQIVGDTVSWILCCMVNR